MQEIEIKFRVDDFTIYRDKLLATGALVAPRQFEDNIVFDDDEGSLFRRGQLLRLRKSDRIFLTFKNPVEQERYKIMEEHEVGVSDFNNALSILLGLGFEQAFRYQKYRETFRVDDALVLLDETPIGNFIEIEGPKETIELVARRLDLDMEAGTSRNYLQLYREHCRAQGEDPARMVFLQKPE